MVNFNSLKMAAKSVQMACKGYTKVPLRDTKGVLDETTNVKWVKQTLRTYHPDRWHQKDPDKCATLTEIVLPSGTKVAKWGDSYKTITKINTNKGRVNSVYIAEHKPVALRHNSDGSRDIVGGLYFEEKYDAYPKRFLTMKDKEIARDLVAKDELEGVLKSDTYKSFIEDVKARIPNLYKMNGETFLNMLKDAIKL